MLIGGVNAVIFDLDGTLRNSAMLMLRGIRAVCKHAGVCPPSMVQFYRTYENEEVWQKSWGVETPYKEIRSIYEATVTDVHSPLFSDARHVLERLSLHSVPVGLVSAAPEADVSAYCTRKGIANHFRVIMADKRHKAFAIGEAIRALAREPHQAMYVGDFIADMKHAKEAGAYAVGITRGRKVRRVLLAAGADACISHLPEIFTV